MLKLDRNLVEKKPILYRGQVLFQIFVSILAIDDKSLLRIFFLKRKDHLMQGLLDSSPCFMYVSN